LSADDLQPVIDVDAEVSLDAVTPELADECARLGPFGSGNAAPVLLTRGLRAVGTRTVGGGAHLRLVVSDGTRSADAIGFRLGDRAELLAFTQARLDLAYGVERDQWREHETVQLVVDQLWTPEVDHDAVTADTGHLLARLFGRADDYLDAGRVEIEDLPAFHTKVVGVTFEGRQATLAQAKAGERLRLARDPSNPRDPHAIKVCLADGREVGFLRAALAARLAPAIDAGARYAATATALTGGGDRAWGLNIYVERHAAWSGDTGAGEPGARPPVGPGFLDWVAARLARGRALPAVHRDVLGTLLDGGRVAVRHGPGRGLLAAGAAAAAALLATGRRPVLLVLPRAIEVEAWSGVLQPWLRGAGLQTLAAHGALPPRVRSRVLEAIERGTVDVIVASAAWTIARTPPAAAVIVIVDDVGPEADLTAIRDGYGDRIRLVSGPGSPERLRTAAGAAGLAPVGSRFDPRVNLRVVDHRGREGHDGSQAGGGSRPEKLLVVAANAAASVAEAQRRRERGGEAGGHTAYYHDRLPAALRRVVEDLYSAGQITSLVAGSLLVHPAVPLDVSRVEVTGLPATRLLAAESLGAGGQGGQTAVVDLRFGPAAVGAWADALEATQPSRESLVRCYQHFKGLGRGGAWAWRSGGPAVGPAGVPVELVPVALEIFLEAGIVAAEGGEGELARYTLVDPSARVDLDRSLRYQEATRERAAFADLRAWATGPASAILAELAQP
jgi:single-stranded-DNA-specific exonuclease